MCVCIEVDLKTCFWPRREHLFLKNMRFVHGPPSRPLGTTTTTTNNNNHNTNDNEIMIIVVVVVVVVVVLLLIIIIITIIVITIIRRIMIAPGLQVPHQGLQPDLLLRGVLHSIV